MASQRVMGSPTSSQRAIDLLQPVAGRWKITLAQGTEPESRVRPRHEELVAQSLGYPGQFLGDGETAVIVPPCRASDRHHLESIADSPLVPDRPRQLDALGQSSHPLRWREEDRT